MLEDRILDELLNHQPTGFYVDVGAHSPIHESVTKVFYDRGWSGINVEPQLTRVQELSRYRPRDINVRAAVGQTTGKLDLYLNDALTTAIYEYAGPSWYVITVEMRPLTQILDEYASNRTIDFLKIDVEGYEAEVIKGMDWNKYRPRYLCVESTRPNTNIDTYSEWDPILRKNGYLYTTDNVYNRFYRDGSIAEPAF